MRATLFSSAIALMAISVCAAPIEYTDLSTFNAAAGAHTILTFTGLAGGTIITSQFAGQGVTFTDGDDRAALNGAFITDGAGVDANGSISLAFSGLRDSIGAEYPGGLQFQLFQGATLVYTSSQFGGSGTGFFAGVTGVTFDHAVISDWVDSAVFVDNLHFSGQVSGVPEPSTAGLFIIALTLFAGRYCWRRRTA